MAVRISLLQPLQPPMHRPQAQDAEATAVATAEDAATAEDVTVVTKGDNAPDKETDAPATIEKKPGLRPAS